MHLRSRRKVKCCLVLLLVALKAEEKLLFRLHSRRHELAKRMPESEAKLSVVSEDPLGQGPVSMQADHYGPTASSEASTSGPIGRKSDMCENKTAHSGMVQSRVMVPSYCCGLRRGGGTFTLGGISGGNGSFAPSSGWSPKKVCWSNSNALPSVTLPWTAAISPPGTHLSSSTHREASVWYTP